jgi:tetratricopeptide (TPR) repeat protein
MELDPVCVSIRRGLGWLYAVAREPESGVAVLRQAVVMNPEAVETRVTLGIVHEQAGQFREAEVALRTALELSPHDTHALVTLARTLARAGRRNEAERIAAEVRGLEASRYVSPRSRRWRSPGDADAVFAAPTGHTGNAGDGWSTSHRTSSILSGDPFEALVRLMRLGIGITTGPLRPAGAAYWSITLWMARSHTRQKSACRVNMMQLISGRYSPVAS